MTDETYRRGASAARKSLGEALGRVLEDGEALRATAHRMANERRSYAPYEPGGTVWEERRSRRSEFEGGAVCWDPEQACEGICRTCPRSQP